MTLLALRTVSQTEAESLTIIAQRAKNVPLIGFGSSDQGHETAANSVFSLSPLPISPAERLLEDSLIVHFQWSGARFLVVCSASNALLLLRRLVDQAPVETLSAAWQKGLDQHLARWLSDAVYPLGRGQADILAVERLPQGASTPGFSHEFSLEADIDGAGAPQVFLRVQTDSLGVHLLAGICNTRDPQPALNDVSSSVPYVLYLTVGSTRLPASVLRTLSARQLVFVDQIQMTSDRNFWCGCELPDGRQMGFIARYENLSITLLRGPMEKMNSISEDGLTSDDLSQGGNDPEAITIDDLPVKLSFDCGSVTLSLAQVEKLSEGQVIPTSQAVNDYVNIRANGALIGRGVLMQVDGRLAVSITHLSTEVDRSQGRSS